jgi:hypothetical protein
MIELGVHTDNWRTLSGNFRGEPKGDILEWH